MTGAMDKAKEMQKQQQQTTPPPAAQAPPGIMGMWQQGQEQGNRLYAAIEKLLPVFEEWKDIAAKQTAATERLIAALEKQG